MNLKADEDQVLRALQCSREIEARHGSSVALCGALSMIEGEARFLERRLGHRAAYEYLAQAADRILARGCAALPMPEIPGTGDGCQGSGVREPGRFSRFLPKGFAGFTRGGRP